MDSIKTSFNLTTIHVHKKITLRTHPNKLDIHALKIYGYTFGFFIQFVRLLDFQVFIIVFLNSNPNNPKIMSNTNNPKFMSNHNNANQKTERYSPN